MKKDAVHANHHVQHRFPRDVRFCALCGGAMERRPVLPDGDERPVCERCGFVFFPSPKLVVGCLVIESGRVLLLKRGNEPSMGKWTFPGGFVDFAERAIDAAVRETAEEVGLQVQIDRLLGVYTDPANHNAQMVAYLARAHSGDPAPSAEALEVHYFTPQEIPWDEIAFRSSDEALHDWIATLKATG
ncbi:MAG TPA: NUDIX hydrolase [Candidatus Binataceae bacterium]|nr:NUDIX hydrolase [Candidatus Binataceae bacterium]